MEVSVDIASSLSLLLGLEIVEKDGTLLGFLSPVTDNDAGAVNDLPSIAFTIELAYIHTTRRSQSQQFRLGPLKRNHSKC
jgi:hypothetical protein